MHSSENESIYTLVFIQTEITFQSNKQSQRSEQRNKDSQNSTPSFFHSKPSQIQPENLPKIPAVCRALFLPPPQTVRMLELKAPN